MLSINDITRGLLGRAALIRRSAPAPAPDPVPVFSAQPMAQVLYQENGAMRITGAAASPVTGWQWQKQNGDGSWSDVAGRTGQTLNISAATAVAGVYRVKAVNGAASTVSNTVQVVSVYLRIQNDSSTANGSTNGTTKVDNTHYTHNAPAGTRYFSAFYISAADDTVFIPTGAASGRALATWVSSNPAVLPNTSVSASGQLTCGTKAGSASLTATAGSLSSVLNATIT